MREAREEDGRGHEALGPREGREAVGDDGAGLGRGQVEGEGQGDPLERVGLGEKGAFRRVLVELRRLPGRLVRGEDGSSPSQPAMLRARRKPRAVGAGSVMGESDLGCQRPG